MELLIRSSVCMIRCSRRMLSSAMPMSKDTRPSKYRFRVDKFVLTESNINKTLGNKLAKISDEHWKEMRTELLNDFQLTEINVDSQLINVLCHYNRNDDVVNYVKFLKRNNHDLNLMVIIQYMKSYYNRYCPLTEEEEKDVCALYDSIRAKHQLLDSTMCTDCILALSLTKRWEECFELLDMLKITSNPGLLVYGAIIAAAFKNDNYAIGWEYMNIAIANTPIHANAFFAHLSYCQRNLKGEELQKEIDKMFLFWREHNITPGESIIQAYCTVYESFGYKSSYTEVTKQGFCKSCKNTLPETSLTSAEFKVLSVSILKDVIIGTNLFCSTSPQELKKYMLFVKTMHPYDVVIDGLNVAYASKRSDKKGSLATILNVVNQFVQENKKVLIIGRAHMSWWNADIMKKLEKIADIYLVKNISKDDPFLLHVTLTSGPQTYFVSKDLMRGHKARLDPSLRNLFKRWQMSRQYLFNVDPNTYKLYLKDPILFDTSAQQDENGWHMPYTESKYLMLPDSYSHPPNWVCLKKNHEVKREKSREKKSR